MEYLVSAFLGYLIGSLPTAYIILKHFKEVDITKNGSNNVGALNSYKVSNSKFIGAVVLVIDLLKGIAAVYLTRIFFSDSFETASLSLIAAVLAHNYSPWIKFKGGRGLATAAGGVLIFEPVILIIWIALWLISFLYKKHIHFSNIIASLFSGILAITSAEILNSEKWFASPPAETNFIFYSLNIILMLIILSRHMDSIKSYFSSIKENKKGLSNE
ncbi:MAG: glycerol-3-phosphate acyltransferase [Melioribacteraceae bacterium]|nr:glycerol-3-phosphate acyltransferase [Melioribacteraceae bacterium]